MDDNLIDDIRTPKELKNLTFSKFKKNDVCNELLNCINKSKIEEALNWSAELICSGFFKDLWESIMLILGKHIHLGNPKLAIYLDNKFTLFKSILENGYINLELQLRNNNKIRKLFAELIIILCESNKKPSFEKIVIKKDDFSLLNISEKFNAPSINYGQTVFENNDPKELFVPINEIAYNIYSNNLLKSCYWIEWIINYDLEKRKKKEILKCDMRNFAPIHEKYNNDIIWIVWQIILNKANKKNPLILKIVKSLLNLFSIKYTFQVKKKRRYLLYFAIELVTETVNNNIPIIEESKKKLLEKLSLNNNLINAVYKIIKKNEIAPNQDYLFNNINSNKYNNLQKSLSKIETLNNYINGDL